jgi:prepilin-type processing-associated H-X9-DG protein
MTQSPPTYPGPLDPPKKGMSTGLIIGIVVGLIAIVGGLLLCLAIGILLPALGKARGTARELTASSQLRMVATSMVIYAQDNKGSLPTPDMDWQAMLVSNGSIPSNSLVSPRAEQSTAPSFFIVPGWNLDTVQNPASFIIAYENPTFFTRDTERVNIAYADGSVQQIPLAQATKLLDALTLPDGTPWAPHKK